MPLNVLSLVLMAIMVFLFEKSAIFRYYFKFTIFIILSLIFASVFIPIMLFRPKDYRNALMPAWGARQISKLLGLKWTMLGKENIVQEQGCVVLINHQSCLDLLVLAEIWPVLQRCTVISKKEVFYLWPFGLACWLWGTVFIDRSSSQQSKETVNQAAETITSRKAKICMFPEGTRHQGNQLLPFKKGAFHIAIESQAAIQPIVVSQYTFVDQKTFKFQQASNTISILPVISTKGLNKDDLENLMQKTYTAMSQEFKSLSKL